MSSEYKIEHLFSIAAARMTESNNWNLCIATKVAASVSVEGNTGSISQWASNPAH